MSCVAIGVVVALTIVPGSWLAPETGLKASAGGSAVSSLPANYQPLVGVAVSIAVTPDAGTLAHAIEDAPPAGWGVSSINEGGTWDSVNARVKWGPFFDATARTFSYVATPPAGASGLATFVGIASFDGIGVAITGARAIADRGPAPILTGIVPAAGATSGGTTITITGSDLRAGARVTLGGAEAAGVSVAGNGLSLTATTAARAAGVVDVVVINPDNQSATLRSAFTYIESGSAIRTLPTRYTPGGTFVVSIVVTPPAGVLAQAIEDAPPVGWTLSGISHGGGWDAGNGTVKWGPFFDATPRTLTYTVTVPATATGAQSFDGVVSFDGFSTAIGGARTVSPPDAVMAVTPAVLNFSGTNAGGVLNPMTPAQAVTVSLSGGAPAWTASADQPWVQVTNGAGAGSGMFSIGVVNPGNVLASVTAATATVTVTAAGATNSPQTVTVNVNLTQSTLPPFGLVSSPNQDAANVQGAVGITGWVLDDVGIDYVRLYRNCLVFEDQLACQWVDGQHVVWMGDATLVTGARSDIEGAYPTYPQNSRAGWGYAMLTNLAPHIPNQQMYGGQGPLTIYVRARDVEGHEAWIGRNFLPGSTTQSDGEPTRITMANDTIAKPFGTIDTPTQGQTVSAALWNWGWALTPDSNTVGGEAGDTLMPLNGSTIRVWIDGASPGTVLYNMCRGAMAPYCVDDIASIFGNLTPQPIGTPRSSNPTTFRNLDANRGAIAGFFLDTTTLANGVHTIAWAAFDNASPRARGDGLGSRYFTVLNAGTDTDRDQATGDRRQGEDRDLGSGAGSVALARRDTTNPQSRLPNPGGEAVLARTGFSLDAPFVELLPDSDGVRHVQLDDMGRLELQFPGSGRASSQKAPSQGYLVVHDEYRPLPVGSQFDPVTGTFTWVPGVGFIGTYRLAFGSPRAEDSRSRAGVVPDLSRTTPALERESLAVVDVTIRPVTPPVVGEALIHMSLDTPQPGAPVSGAFVVAGWALDPQAAFGSGIGAVHVWAQRTDLVGAAPVFLGSASLAGGRQDVAAAYGPQFDRAGFGLRVEVRRSPGALAEAGNVPAIALDPGPYDVTAYVWNTRTARWEDARSVRVVVR